MEKIDQKTEMYAMIASWQSSGMSQAAFSRSKFKHWLKKYRSECKYLSMTIKEKDSIAGKIDVKCLFLQKRVFLKY